MNRFASPVSAPRTPHSGRAVALGLRAATALLFACTLLLAGCRPPDGGSGSGAAGDGDAARTVRAELASEPAVGPAEVRVTVLEGGEPVEGAGVEIVGDMTHAGMAPVLADATDADGAAGVYLSEDFEFSMAGDWILTVDVTYPDGSEVREEVRLTVPGGGNGMGMDEEMNGDMNGDMGMEPGEGGASGEEMDGMNGSGGETENDAN